MTNATARHHDLDRQAGMGDAPAHPVVILLGHQPKDLGDVG